MTVMHGVGHAGNVQLRCVLCTAKLFNSTFMRKKAFILSFLLGTSLNVTQVSQASSMFDGFIDPKDGMLDASDWMAEQKGVVPLPMLITEPAVGYGLGLALLFLHDPLAGSAPKGKSFDAQSDSTKDKLVPPSISAAFGMYTENETWVVGGLHLGIWKNDNVRYLGVGMAGSINLNLYGLAATEEQPLKFNIELAMIKQGVKFRLADSNFFAGVNYLLIATKSEFDPSRLGPGIAVNSESQDAAVTINVDYDSRDTIFTPSRGINASLEASLFRDVFGGDADYEKYLAKATYFTPVIDTVIIGLRGQVEQADGAVIAEIPVYQYPFVDLRGIPAMRYQGKTVGEAEVEVRWDITPRYSFIGFGGAGRYNSIIGNASPTNVYTKGIGVRYLVARRFRLRAGFDIAKGPEDTAFYIQFGQAW